MFYFTMKRTPLPETAAELKRRLQRRKDAWFDLLAPMYENLDKVLPSDKPTSQRLARLMEYSPEIRQINFFLELID